MSKVYIQWGTDEQFIKNYLELKSSQKMAILYNCSKTSILSHAKKINFDVNSIKRQHKLSEQDKQNIIDAYQKETSTALAQKYNVSRGMITKIWYDANLKGKKRTVSLKRDLTNQKFNRLTALYPTEQRSASGCVMWYCKCDCGKEKIVSGSDLYNGLIKSCGCLSKECLELGRKANDLTGKQFGKLTVIERCEDKIFSSKEHSVQWLCQCSCGRKTKVLASNLITGNTQSCGFCNENSHGNIKIDKILTEANIPFQREKKFLSCADKMPLPFDFYVNNSYLIEYDGRQHFEDTNTIFNYELIHKHDLIKSNWCKENNIPLIRIPYTHYNDLSIQDLLLQSSKFIEKI